MVAPRTAQIDRINPALAELCEAQYHQIGWTKPDGYCRSCYEQQQSSEIVMFVAHDLGQHGSDQYVGHAKLVWEPDYPGFQTLGIPEIQDLNVLPNYRKHGIGTALIESCERLAAERYDEIGIGVGLHPGYNNAQRLYSKLGYILDGCGVHYRDEPVGQGQTYRFDDDLVICFTKYIGKTP